MKAFWLKVINIAVICLILFVYQSAVRSNMKLDRSISTLKEQLLQEDAEAVEDEAGGSLYKDGTYEGTGTGYAGDIKVQVIVKNGVISSIEITETSDDPAYLNMAKELTDIIIDGQTTEGVDTISGATFSSRGILDAVGEALKGAEK